MSIEFTSHVLGLSHSHQVRHWASWNPWRFQGKNVRLPGGPRLTKRNVTVRKDGSLVRITRTVERPCFGSPVAFLVHGGERWITARNGETFPSRCNSRNCPAAEACAYVAKRRLRATDAIATAHDAFDETGGLLEWKRERQEGRPGRAGRAWGALLKALDDHGAFACVNTDRLQQLVAARLADNKRKEAERKKAARLAERRARMLDGTDDELFLQQLLLETNLRALSFELARGRPDTPPWISRCPANQAVSTADVWRAKMLVLSRGQKVNPGKVTRQLVNEGLIEPNRENAQRNGAIAAALDRVRRLETINWTGEGPTWERTSVEALVEDSAGLAACSAPRVPPQPQRSGDPLQLAA